MDNITQELLELLDNFRKEPPNPARTDNQKSAVSFENKYGVKDISQQYAMPEGISQDELWALRRFAIISDNVTTDKQFDDIFAKIWTVLVASNPDLQKLNALVLNNEHRYDAVSGVLSEYNVDDVAYLLSTPQLGQPDTHETWLQAREAMQNGPEYKKASKAFNRAALEPQKGFTEILTWMPAPVTLRRMEKQFKSKLTN